MCYIEVHNLLIYSGGSRGGARGAYPPLFWVKKEEMTEERKAPLAQCLDPPLAIAGFHEGPLF